MRHFYFLLAILLISFSAQCQTIGSKVSFSGTDGRAYTATITDIQGDKYKLKYDGFDYEAWATKEQFKVISNAANNQPVNNNYNQQSNGKFSIGQKVEAYNITWYKATVIGFGTGDLAGYIKVHYDDYSSASDQYLKESSIRIPKTAVADNYGAGPRNGRYTILSYGNINNPITLGYFDLNNGRYIYYTAAKKVIGNGTYKYDAGEKKVIWQNGPLTEYGPSAGFEIDREGKTHKIRLKYSTIGSNSTDS